MRSPARTSTWERKPKHWLEDSGLPIRSPIQETDLPRELLDRFPLLHEALAIQLQRALWELEAISRTSWWWAVMMALPGVGFALTLFLGGAYIESTQATSADDALEIWYIVVPGVAIGLVAGVVFARWLLSFSGRMDRWIGGALGLAFIVIIVLQLFGIRVPQPVLTSGAIAYLMVILLSPVIVIGQLIPYLLPRHRVRRHSQEHYAVALLCGLVTGALRAERHGNSPRDAAHQQRMLWGLEDLARTVVEERSLVISPWDPRTLKRQAERAARRAEAIRYWKDDVLEPAQHSIQRGNDPPRRLLPDQLAVTLERALERDWSALPEAGAVDLGPGWRDWWGAVFAAFSVGVLYYSLNASTAALNGEVLGTGDLLDQVSSLTPFLAVGWGWILMPPSVKQVLGSRLAGLKEIKELR